VVSAFLSAVQAGEVRPMVPREGRITLPEIEARTARRR